MFQQNHDLFLGFVSCTMQNFIFRQVYNSIAVFKIILINEMIVPWPQTFGC